MTDLSSYAAMHEQSSVRSVSPESSERVAALLAEVGLTPDRIEYPAMIELWFRWDRALTGGEVELVERAVKLASVRETPNL